MLRLSVFIALLSILIYPQAGREAFVAGFIDKLVNDPASISSLTDPAALQKAERMGIEYKDAPVKFLAGSEIPALTRDAIRNGKAEISHTIENLPHDFYRVAVTIPSIDWKRYFYFSGEKLVAPSKYLTLYWTKYETGWFDFFVREKKSFNSYTGLQIERTLNGIMKLLEFTDEEKAELKKNKLTYIVALNEKNVGEFTGEDAKGAFLPAWDEIVTTSPLNLAGLAEQLLRFKLRRMNLATPKLFGEGFASALGGISPRMSGLVVKLGTFVQQQGIVDVAALATDSSWNETDRSFSVPLSAAYNHFIISNKGIKEYLRLFMQRNSPNEKSTAGNAVTLDVPYADEFREYATRKEFEKNIIVQDVQDSLPMIFDSEMVRIFDAGDYLWFHTKGSFALTEEPGINDYTSKIFKETERTRSYQGEKYLISVTREDIVIYNLYTDAIIDAHYKFVDKYPVAGVSNIYRFRVKKSVFEEPINQLKVVQFY
mgnify:FL=1